MKSSDDVFFLIQSLTSAEKRYFKVFSSMHVIGEQNNYVRLFDAMNQMQEYDEEHVKEVFRGERFIEHLSSEKVHLNRLILRSLRAFRDGKTIGRQLTTMVEEAEILTEKRLYRQALKILRKAERIARQHEDFSMLIKILNLYRTHTHDMQSKNVEAQIGDIVADTNDVLHKLENQVRYQNLYDTVFARARMNLTGGVEDEAIDAETQRLLASEDAALSFEAKLRYNTIHAINQQMKGNFEGSFAYRKRILELWREQPHRIKEEPQRFIRASSNFINSCLHVKHYDDLPDVVENLRSLKNMPPHVETEVTQNIFYIELLYSLNTGHIERGLAITPEVTAWMEEHADKINKARLLALYYNLAIIHFVAEQHADALVWLNAIVNDGQSDSRKDIQQFTRLLLPIVYYELGHDDILENKYRAAQYYLSQRGQTGDFEKAVLDFLRKLPWHNNQREFTSSCTHLREEIEHLQGGPKGMHILGLQELLYWLESKITGKAMAALFREQAVL